MTGSDKGWKTPTVVSSREDLLYVPGCPNRFDFDHEMMVDYFDKSKLNTYWF